MSIHRRRTGRSLGVTDSPGSSTAPYLRRPYLQKHINYLYVCFSYVGSSYTTKVKTFTYFVCNLSTVSFSLSLLEGNPELLFLFGFIFIFPLSCPFSQGFYFRPYSRVRFLFLFLSSNTGQTGCFTLWQR